MKTVNQVLFEHDSACPFFQSRPKKKKKSTSDYVINELDSLWNLKLF